MSLYFVMRLLLTVSNQMENPFGNDRVDHPLGQFCTKIEMQVNAIKIRETVDEGLAFAPSVRAARIAARKGGDSSQKVWARTVQASPVRQPISSSSS